jgi:transposase-like protein
MMTSYSPAFKARVVQRLVGPRAISANRLAPSVGVSQETLSRWLREAHSVEGMTKKRQPKWTGAEKLRVVIAAQDLSETALGALLRREGLHAAQLAEWRAAAETALAMPAVRVKVGPSVEAQRIQALERELRRKDRALAETAALLVLKKKVQAIWGDADDTTDPMRAR